MTQIVEGILTIVKGLKPREREQLVRELLESGVLGEDEQDALVIQSRRGGRTRPLDSFVRDMKRKGRIR
jgi:hypothetical protein